jgi:hypothetical protein
LWQSKKDHKYIFKNVLISEGKEVDIAGINEEEYLKDKINDLERDHEARNNVELYRILRELRRFISLERIW